MLPTIKEFSETSQIHGLAFGKGKGKLSVIFWISLVVVAVCLTSNDFFTLVFYYQTEPTVMLIGVKSAKEILLTTPTLCIESPVFFTLSDFRVANISSEVDQFLLETHNGRKIDFDRYRMKSDRVQYYTHNMLSYFTDLDLYYIGEENKRQQMLRLATELSRSAYKERLGWIAKYYVDRNVSFVNLKRLVGMSICQKHFDHFRHYRYPGDPATNTLPLCKATMITHVSYATICTKLFESPTVPINSSTGHNTFAIGNTLVVQSFAEEKTYEYIHTNDVQSTEISDSFIKYIWTLDFDGRPLVPFNIRTNTFSWSPTNLVTIDISVKQISRMHNRAAQPCSVSNDYQNCLWGKKANLMSQSCGCWPSTLFHLGKKPKKNMSDCSTTIMQNFATNLSFNKSLSYEQCDEKLSYLNEVDKLCRPDCDLKTFRITQNGLGSVRDEQSTWERNDKGGYFELRYYPDETYTQINEVVSTSWTSFAWQFGGSMGTWLGGSLLALVHIPMFIVGRIVGGKKGMPKTQDIYPTVNNNDVV